MSTGQPIALVTGASGDIGGAIAQALGSQGWHVIGTYIGEADAAATTVTTITDAGGSAEAIQLDQRDPDAIEALIETIRQNHGRLDVLINNAAWNIGIPFRRLDELTSYFTSSFRGSTVFLYSPCPGFFRTRSKIGV